MEAEHRAALASAKLEALVRDHWGDGDRVRGTFPGGASLSAGKRGWVLVGPAAHRRFGAALTWARHRHVDDLAILADDAALAAVLARRGRPFVASPAVYRVRDRELVPVEPAAHEPIGEPNPAQRAMIPLLVEMGLEVAIEGRVILGEVHGLEVARVLADPGDGSPPDGSPADGSPADGSGSGAEEGAAGGAEDGAHLEVGVGRFDREAQAMVSVGLTDADSLARATELVRRTRHPHASRHRINQLVPERWLRAELVADPSPVGATELTPVASAVPRTNLIETAPATAVGTDPDGSPVVVTTSVGIDLDLVPTAADDRALHAPGARLVIVAPPSDVIGPTRDLAASLAEPAEVVALTGGWQGDC